jgi:tetratricopeptide (TPR) repeat protein
LEAYLEAKSRLDAARPSPGYQEEIALLGKAEELAPDMAEAFLAHASIERFLAGELHDPQRFARAEELLQKAAQADPEHPELPLRQAQLAQARGETAQAVSILRQLTQRRPGDPAAWAALGSALAHLGQKGESEKAFARALSLQPAITFWASLSSARADRGDFALARQAAEEILRRAPEHPLGLFRLAYVAGLVGDFATCANVYSRLFPQTQSLLDLLNWGTCAFYAGQLDKAQELYEKATALAPNDPRPWANLADTFLWQGKQSQAQEHFRKALQLLEARPLPNRTDLYPHLLAHVGRLEEAILAAQKAVAEAPNRNWNLFVAAEVAALAGDKVSMLAYAKRALELRAPQAWFAGPEFAPYRALPEFQALLAGKP